jgi:membrane-associated phospholipid phosphatase
VALAHRLRALDEALLLLARTRGHPPQAERGAAMISRLGEHGALWLALGAGGAALAPRGERRERWRAATATVVGAYALNTAVKFALRRPRPQLDGLPPLARTPTALSFPSAHATTSFAAARAFAKLGLPRAPLYAVAALLAGSRVYLGVHYPSDVLAGAILGSLSAR